MILLANTNLLICGEINTLKIIFSFARNFKCYFCTKKNIKNLYLPTNLNS